MWLLPSLYLCSPPLAPSARPARCVLHWDSATTHGRTTLALKISHPARARGKPSRAPGRCTLIIRLLQLDAKAGMHRETT